MNFIQGFHAFLLGEKNMSQNSSTKHLKFLKKLLNLSVANSYITNNNVNAYKVEREPVEIDFLNEEDIKEVEYGLTHDEEEYEDDFLTEWVEPLKPTEVFETKSEFPLVIKEIFEILLEEDEYYHHRHSYCKHYGKRGLENYCHNYAADDHTGGTERHTEEHIYEVLHLGYVVGKSGDERACRELIDIGEGELLNFAVNVTAKIGSKVDRCLRAEVRTADTAKEHHDDNSYHNGRNN